MLPPTRLPWLRPVGHRRCLSSATLQQGAAQLFVRPPRWGVVALAKGRKASSPGEADAGEAAPKPGRRGRPRKGADDGGKGTQGSGSLNQVNQAYLDELRREAAAREAARGHDPEEDPRRISFHRALLTAASSGAVDRAQDILDQMSEAGLEPGPRAIHVLLFAYVKAKMAHEALEVARRCREQNIQLLPETYVILIYAFVNLPGGPDVEQTKALLESMIMQEGVAGAQAGWLMACKELFGRGKASDAMLLFLRGVQQQGYTGDAGLYAYAIQEMCKQGKLRLASEQLKVMEGQGINPGPSHYNPLLQALASAGRNDRAMALLSEVNSNNLTWLPPDADSYNALLAGMLLRLKPGSPPEAVERIEVEVTQLMRQSGLRPSNNTHKAVLEAHVRLGFCAPALKALKAMSQTNGGLHMLSRKSLADLLLLTAREQRPVDLLQLLSQMETENLRMPRRACAALSPGGGSLLSAWLEERLHVLRDHRATVAEAEQGVNPRSFTYVDGVQLGMANCVADNYGVFIAPSKMTLDELRVESEVNGMSTDGLTRAQMVRQVKARRDSLPEDVKVIQASAKDDAKKEKTAAGLMTEETKRKGRASNRQFRIIRLKDGKVDSIQNVVREEYSSRNALNFERAAGSDPTAGLMDSFGNTERQMDLEEIVSGGVEEGVTDILGDEETTEALAVDEEDSGAMLGALAREKNETAGMDVAVEMLRLLTSLRGQPQAQDLRVLVKGAVAEANADAALQLSQRLHLLLGRGAAAAAPEGDAAAQNEVGASREEVAGLFEDLARLCISTRHPAHADIVLARAEARDLPISPAVISELEAALNGRPRQKDITIDTDMVDGNATGLLEDEDLGDEEDDDLFFPVDDEEDDASLALLPASGSGALADAAFATGDDDADGTWAAGDGRLQFGDDEGDVEVGEEGLQQALARVKAQARQVLASEAAGEAEGQEAPELQLLRESLVEVLGPEDGVHLASFIRSDTLPLGELDMGLEEEEEAGEGEEEAPGGSAQLREVESELMRILEDLDTLDQPAAADGGAAGEVEDEDEDQGLEEQEEGEQDAGEELDESWVLAEDEEEVQQRAEEYVAGVKRMDAELLRLYGRWVIGAAQLEDVVGDIQQLGEALQLPDREHYEELLSGRVADAGLTDSEFLQLHAEMQAGEAAPHEVVQQLRERLHSGELQHGQLANSVLRVVLHEWEMLQAALLLTSLPGAPEQVLQVQQLLLSGGMRPAAALDALADVAPFELPDLTPDTPLSDREQQVVDAMVRYRLAQLGVASNAGQKQDEGGKKKGTRGRKKVAKDSEQTSEVEAPEAREEKAASALLTDLAPLNTLVARLQDEVAGGRMSLQEAVDSVESLGPLLVSSKMSALIDSAVVKAVAAAQESGQLPQTEGSAGSDNAAGDPANVALMLLEALSEEDVRVEGVRQRLQSGELGTEEAVKEVLSLGPMPNAELGGSAQLPALREDRMLASAISNKIEQLSDDAASTSLPASLAYNQLQQWLEDYVEQLLPESMGGMRALGDGSSSDDAAGADDIELAKLLADVEDEAEDGEVVEDEEADMLLGALQKGGWDEDHLGAGFDELLDPVVNDGGEDWAEGEEDEREDQADTGDRSSSGGGRHATTRQ